MRQFTRTILFFSFVINASAQDTAHVSKPFFVSLAEHRTGINTVYSYQLTAGDSAALPLSFFVKKIPGWLSYDSVKKIITGKAVKAGQYPVQLLVTNQHRVTEQNFILTVYDKKTVNILCLGNSITNGTNKYNSYRRELWQMLHHANYNFDFIGSWDKHSMGGETPNPDFDMDHDGHSGWRFDDIFHPPSWDSARGNIHEWLKIYKPGIVLLDLGTNDVFQCRTVDDMLKDLLMLVNVLREKNGNVKIFLAQIPPLGKQWAQKKLCGDSTDYDHTIRNVNKAYVSFAKKNSEKKSPIVLVDQYNGIDTGTEMYDDIHPNEAGEKKMAEKWFNAIHKFLNKLN